MRARTTFDTYCSQVNSASFSVIWPILRIALGIQFLISGLMKFSPTWSASGYLEASTGPLRDFFISLSGSSLVDSLNAWGLTLIGLALILGLFVRPASFFGVILMILYFLSHLEQNTIYGPINYHIIYTFIFFLYISGGAGHAFGLDSLIHENTRKHWLKFLTK